MPPCRRAWTPQQSTTRHAPGYTVLQPVTGFVAENTPASEPIGDPVDATDADGDTLTYTLWGADAEHFASDAKTGQIFTNGTYDFEKKKGYAVIVRASLVVRIDITDVDG